MKSENLVQVACEHPLVDGPLKFFVREGSSDAKSIREVVVGKGYERRDFQLNNGLPWVDLGANIGAFAVLAARMGMYVWAYEPDPSNIAILARNVKLNGVQSLVSIHQAAVVASDAKTLPMSVNAARGNYWRNSVVKEWRGGFTIDVPAVHWGSAVRPGANLKMDIEGAEFAILEALDKKPAARMVFEWSFDIDRSIPRFSKVVNKLRGWYGDVRYGKFDESQDLWQGSWFPPCRTVWCK